MPSVPTTSPDPSGEHQHSHPPTAPAARPRVVIIGSGFGGLFAAKRLRRENVEVTLMDRTTHHLFQPLLYQVATGILSEGEIAPSVREILRRQRNATVLRAEVTAVDLSARQVTAISGGTELCVPYDSLIVAAGAGHSYFGHPEFEQYAPGMKTIEDALRLRARIFGAFEQAEVETDPVERERCLTFVVVGAGPTGVEMAGQLLELSRRSLRRNFRNIDPQSARVVLVEGGPTVLATFGDDLSARTTRSLAKLGVEIETNAMVVGVDEDGVDVRDDTGVRRIEARTKVWAAGVSVSPVGELLGASTSTQRNRNGQLRVLPDCSLPGHPEVFVVGDMIDVGVPGVAQVAIQSGRHAAAVIAARQRGRRVPGPFHYRNKGTLATISKFRAVGSVGPLRLSGYPAWVLWLFVHLTALVGFKNRVLVLVHWLITFTSNSRAERTAPAVAAVAPPAKPGADGAPARVATPRSTGGIDGKASVIPLRRPRRRD